MNDLVIAGRLIGPGHPCFIIAEAGVNHNGDVALGLKLIDAAHTAHADAVKFQTFSPQALAAEQAPKAEYQKQSEPAGQSESQLAMLERLALSPEAHRQLKAHAEAKGILFLSSPFDRESADFLVELDTAALKIPSGEVTNLPFLRYLAQKHLPLLMSTGMCTLDEVAQAVSAIRQAGNPPLGLFHCVSSYPARAADANLRCMQTLREAFSVPVGWSDHTLGIELGVASAALGGNLIEKHLTLDRNLAGPDHRASLEPKEFADLVTAVRSVESALGDGKKAPVAAELEIAQVARKSLFWKTSLPAGSEIRAEHLAALRPGTGLSPALETEFVGKKTARAVRAGDKISKTDI